MAPLVPPVGGSLDDPLVSLGGLLDHLVILLRKAQGYTICCA